MATKLPQAEATTLPGRTRANIGLTISGFLVSLTMKGALDTAFGTTIPLHAITTHGLIAAILVFPTLQVGVFLVTLIRFVYGTYRFEEEGPSELKKGVLLWNIIGSFVLFVLFYITSLSILHAAPFYASIGAVHAWDLFWFLGVLLQSRAASLNIKKVIKTFILIDVGTVILLMLAHFFVKDHFMGCGVGIMALFTGVDVFANRQFFFHPDEWRDL